ncbi:MAG: AMP-binding protein [Bacteroidetes bacterium]|jgi:long-subunit acyl-CoA synthetase (AMP-forming)|nr:AMP-binding protein [Bacteroidota bacterium]
MKASIAGKPLGPVIPNIATMLRRNSVDFGPNQVFAQKADDGEYHGITWAIFFQEINCIAANLKELGFSPGDKMVLFSRNQLHMLQMELAVMAYGGIAVPIFAHFKRETAELLIKHSEARWLFVEGQSQLDTLPGDLEVHRVFVSDSYQDGYALPCAPFAGLLVSNQEQVLDYEIKPDSVCLNMFTSGTMGLPKCVQLTHGNILSQQAGLSLVWDLGPSDRFLSYLPWHHSFGGIFELFTALRTGATYFLESSYGKSPESIFNNWNKVRPTVFFSVPKVYQALYDLTRESKEAEDVFFNSGLKFIFTAAAALPERLSAEFEKRGIPVIEGWGLTETSPCCTLTNPSLKREPGLVGMPLPGVQLRISHDEEIQVKGPNVMLGYFNNDAANQEAFTPDGWYRTGDVGALGPNGLTLIARKDRIFKLSNGEKVIPTDLEKAIELRCHYVQYAVVTGSGEEHPVALIFPNKKLLEQPDYQVTPEEGCFCPRSLNELGRCFSGCLELANNTIGQKFAKVKSAAIIMDELSLEGNTLTPSMKMAPKNVLEKYRAHLKNLYGEQVPVNEEVYVIDLNKKHNIK